jgi:hypothetical protein
MLFHALIFSRINYGIEVYGNPNQSTLHALHVAANKVLRNLQDQNRYSNVKELYLNYNVLPISLLFKLSIGKLIFKCLRYESNRPMSSIIKELFLNRGANHDYATRLSNSNHLYLHSNHAFFNSIIFSSYQIWNSIPESVTNAVNLHSFQIQFKNHLFMCW